MGALVMNMDRIRSETGACVLFVHHSGKDAAKGARGHSCLRAAIDSEFELVADEETGARSAAVVKQRDLPKGAVFEFRLEQVTLGQNPHGEDVTTCLVESETATVQHVDRKARERSLNVEERGWLKDISDFFHDPRRAHQDVRLDPDMPVVRAAKREDLRVWLVRLGRIGALHRGGRNGCNGCNAADPAGADHLPQKDDVTCSVTPPGPVEGRDRVALCRYLNRLKDKGKLGTLDGWWWML
jgi:hypothetical protein